MARSTTARGVGRQRAAARDAGRQRVAARGVVATLAGNVAAHDASNGLDLVALAARWSRG